MTVHHPDLSDALFGPAVDATSWQPRSDVDQIFDNIDQTLELIAEATSTAAGLRPVHHYDLSVIVPVYNERETLPQVLARLDEVMPPATEIIIIDDGSIDGTSEWLAELARRANRKIIRRRGNHGKGSAVRLAIRHTRGRVIAIQDADLEYDPADLLGVVWPVLMGEADAVYGSRYLRAGSDPSWLHRWGNRLLTGISNALTGLRLTDMETCHKAFQGDLLRSIMLRECRFGFEPEITAKLAARGAKIREVPTHYQARGYDQGKKIGYRDAVAALAVMWRYRSGSLAR